MTPSEGELRAALRDVLAQSGLSKRGLSLVMGRDIGYVGALLDPSRPSRARPTPADLLATSDATGIPFVDLLERFWGVPAQRLADEATRLGLAGPSDPELGVLTERERATLGDFGAFLVARHRRRDGPARPG